MYVCMNEYIYIYNILVYISGSISLSLSLSLSLSCLGQRAKRRDLTMNFVVEKDHAVCKNSFNFSYSSFTLMQYLIFNVMSQT